MKVILILRRGRKNVGVLTDTGIRVKVPVSLGFVGTELDEDRVCQSGNTGKYEYVELDSIRHKHKYAESHSSEITLEDWNRFISLSERYLEKYRGFGWLKSYQFSDWYEGWLDKAYRSGVHFRMSKMDKIHQQRYIHASVRGYLKDLYRKMAKEPQPYSFEVLESMGML
jgi:hypothetical protein